MLNHSKATDNTILLVEDDNQMLEMLAEMLRTEGYTVLATNDSKDAVQKAKDQEIRLLITDLVMPNIGGLELAGWFRDNYPDAKILIISGYTDDMVILHEKLTTNTTFLSKPLRPATFIAKVADLLSH